MPVLSELHLYPIKSCAGIALQEATLTPMGLMSAGIYDRQWMVVDVDGEAMTQREFPLMALIVPCIVVSARNTNADAEIDRDVTLVLSAPDMSPLSLPLARADGATATCASVQIWDDQVDACDCGDAAAQWFSAVIGRPCRLVRFASDAERYASTKWTDGLAVPTHFSDAFPLLIIGDGSLEDLNQKLIAQGRAALSMNRFRPNIVIGDLPAFEEDFAESYTLDASVSTNVNTVTNRNKIADKNTDVSAKKIILKSAKPCVRCTMPSVDQTTGICGPDPIDILCTYRANPKVDDGICFGMNAIVLEGAGCVVRVGQTVEVNLAF